MFPRLFCMAIAIVWTLSGSGGAAQTLRLVNDGYLGPSGKADAPGFGVEVLRDVFHSLGQDVSFELLATKHAWMMVARGERDGMLATLRTSEGERFCSFPSEPLVQDKWVFFVRTADIGKLKFSSFYDLVGHDVAIHDPEPGVSEQAISPALSKFLSDHHNMVKTNDDTAESLRMLAAGRFDYALLNLAYGMSEIARIGLSGKIAPLLSRSVVERGIYICFSKERVAPAVVDAFSDALKQFKQTEAFQAIYRRYFP
ncbi:transporter substrate-binding domain-containing protein [Bradyrhizobium sp. CB2312]|uniref:substrate-binding periplasmic protein n=1 Tax=Bradyrhizobium sp. CB2312 TaxID=3039155 RepID=UPI0024B1DC8B|nr:transporter substrate-binding domain-containing protein [Bradyrhizobium sp. CB2312]WFU76856.1 transporter substrate-binding domain-containing protein [Bradyrhizobium sp. CB2312]